MNLVTKEAVAASVTGLAVIAVATLYLKGYDVYQYLTSKENVEKTFSYHLGCLKIVNLYQI